MLFKLSHAIAITLLLYLIMGINNPRSVNRAQTPDAQPELEVAEDAEDELKAFPNRHVRAINLER